MPLAQTNKYQVVFGYKSGLYTVAVAEPEPWVVVEANTIAISDEVETTSVYPVAPPTRLQLAVIELTETPVTVRF